MSASASAATLRDSSGTVADAAAMTGYHTYLSALASGADDSASASRAVVDAAAAGCPGALADTNRLSATQLRKSAMTAFGNEVDAALALAYLGPSRVALNRFAATLAGLSWPTRLQATTTVQLIAAERAVLNTAQPDLCADATTLDVAPLSEPSTTRSFLNHYRNASGNLQTALAAFGTLLGRYETSSERKLIGQINALVAQFSSQSTSTEQADATTLLSDLGVKS